MFQHALLLITASAITGSALVVFARDVGFRSVIFTFGVNWFLLAWAAITYRLARPSFGAAYYRSKPFERHGRLYTWLGVLVFKRLMHSSVCRRLFPTFRFKSSRRMLVPLEQALHGAETGHTIVFGIVLLLSVYALMRGWCTTAGWLLVFNMLINGYPVMLQRYNRARLDRVRRRQLSKARSDKQASRRSASLLR